MPPQRSKTEIISSEFVVSWPRWRGSDLEPLPQVCFCGRSNVGKSSLLNCLAGRKALARTSRTPGRTQALNVFLVTMRQGEEIRRLYFVDLPGYGFAKAPKDVRAQWRPMMESFLVDNMHLQAAAVLLDIRHDPTRQDLDLLDLLTENEVPAVPIATKVDKIGKTQRTKHLTAIARKLGTSIEDIRPFSAVTRQGRDEILEEIFELAVDNS